MTEQILTGGCNCGAVRYEISAKPLAVVACHCTQCRRQSGSAYSINLIIRASAMTIKGKPALWLDTGTESGADLAREFCAKCGSPIRSVPTLAPNFVALKAGTLDEPNSFAPEMHIWTQSKLNWVTIADGMPVFEQNALR